jgi:hypothetical protein
MISKDRAKVEWLLGGKKRLSILREFAPTDDEAEDSKVWEYETDDMETGKTRQFWAVVDYEVLDLDDSDAEGDEDDEEDEDHEEEV